MLHHTFNNQIVRDLAWALSSPALMHIRESTCEWYRQDGYRQLLEGSEDWLRQLDQDHGALTELVASEKDQRLGRYFELLWAWWFKHSPHYDIVGQNIQLRHEGRTLGELDLLVQERDSGRVIHLELAVKFYLGVGDTRAFANWHGPGKKDRLDIKLDALLQRQTRLGQNPLSRQLLADRGIHIDACGVILKGRLFYPSQQPLRLPQGSNPEHLKGRWLTITEFQQQGGSGYVPLARRGWMAGIPPQTDEEQLSAREITERVAAGELRLPLYLTAHQNLQEIERLFVVPDEWSTTL